MKVFVAGGTGVLGRRVVPALVSRGHEVTAVVRSAEKAAAVRAAGATPVEVSLFDPQGLKEAVAGHDAVVNLATSIPPASKSTKAAAWEPNHRIRRAGSRNLVDAALDAGVGRYLQESITFLYADGGDRWLDEQAEVRPTPVTASALDAEANAARFGADGGIGIVLRFGGFYAADTAHTIDIVKLARRGIAAFPGDAGAYIASVHVDDAAAAVVAALEEAPSGTYNAVDDDPVTRGEFAALLASAVGRRKLRGMPSLMVRLLGDKLDHVARSQRVYNQALRTATSWRPTVPSVREGLPAVVRGG